MKSLKFLTEFLLKSKKNIILGIVFTLFMSVTEIFPGIIYKVIADSLTNLSANSKFLSIKIPVKFLDMKFDPYKFSIKNSDQIFKVFVLICVIFLVIYILDGLFRYLRDIYFNFAIQKILKDIKDTICEKILNLPFPEFKRNKTGDLMSRITYDTTILYNIIDVFIELSRSSISLLIFCPILFYIDWKISVFATLFFPISVYLIKYFSKKMKKLSKGISDTTADYTEFIKDKVERNQAVKLAGAEEQEFEKFKSLTVNNYELAVKNIKIKYFLKPSNEIIGIFGIAVIAVYFCYMLVNKEMGAGNIVLYLSILKSAYKPFKKVAESIGDLHFSLAGADKIVTLLEVPKEDKSGTDDIKKIENIEFKDVQLSFDGEIILDNISFILLQGKSYGITGVSGSGKTSLVNIIPAFYKQAKGDVLINGKSITAYNIKSLRKKIAFVNNENSIINGTVFDNLTYGIENPEKALNQFISMQQISDFLGISDFSPDLNIGKNGKVLSTGQLQKIILINSILKDADVYIIDEGLDLLSSEDIDKYFNFLSKDRIVVIISRQEQILNRLGKVFKINGHSFK